MSGLTLLEVLVSTAILAAAVAMIYGIYATGSELWETKRDQADLQATARRALDEMAKELRQATRTSAQGPSPNLVITAPPDNTQIDFYLPRDIDGNGSLVDAAGNIEWDTGNLITYYLDPATRTVKCTEGAQERIVAHDVSDLKFIDHNIEAPLYLTELRITLTLSRVTPRQRTLTITLSSTIRLRN
jgi:type II secretory pathway component PulJ